MLVFSYHGSNQGCNQCSKSGHKFKHMFTTCHNKYTCSTMALGPVGGFALSSFPLIFTVRNDMSCICPLDAHIFCCQDMCHHSVSPATPPLVLVQILGLQAELSMWSFCTCHAQPRLLSLSAVKKAEYHCQCKFG